MAIRTQERLNMSEELEQYLEYLISEGKKFNTIRNYKSVLTVFENACGPVRKCSKTQLLEFIASSSHAIRTRVNRKIVLKSIFNWMEDRNLILENPIHSIGAIKIPRELPKNILTKGEVYKLLESFPKGEIGSKEHQNRLIVELMFSCSLRQSELINIRVNDFDPVSKLLRIAPAKTGRGRIVPVGGLASEMLGSWLEKLSRKENEHVFLTKKGKPLYSQHVSDLVRIARKTLNIRTKATSHSLRKTSATLMLKNHAPLEVVQELLGHSCMNTTQIYTKLVRADLFKMHAKHHPREKHKAFVFLEPAMPVLLYDGDSPRCRKFPLLKKNEQ
jgi:integrase/recombinase XerD